MTSTDSELGRSLMTERGMQWLYAHGSDPYALVLRAEGEDRKALANRIVELDPLHRSRTGAWVTGDAALGAKILGDPRLAPNTPLGQCDLFTAPSVVPTVSETETRRVCDEALNGLTGELDLAADVVRPVLATLAADLLGVSTRDTFASWCAGVAIALDAVVCPPRLADARALLDAAAGLRTLGPDVLLVSTVGIEMAANVVLNTMRARLDETVPNDPPVRLDSRIATTDLLLAGTPIAEGDEVVVHVEAAGLTGGPHADLLAPLVRTWTTVLLESLPAMRAAGPVVTRLRAPVTDAIVRFPVRW